MGKAPKLPKHGKAFALAYIKNGRNATEAARSLPGISEKSTSEIGSRLLRNIEVQKEIARLEKKLEDKTLITKERVLNELALIGFSDMADCVTVGSEGQIQVKPFDQMPKGASRAISRIKEKRSIRQSQDDSEDMIIDLQLEYGHHDKVDALKEIAKLQGYYPKEELDVNHKGSISVAVEVVDFSKLVRPKSGASGS